MWMSAALFMLVGKRESHGCIRLTNWDAREPAGMVVAGMPAQLTK